MRTVLIVVLCGVVGGLGCSTGTAYTGELGELGEPCESDDECESGQCIPYGDAQICSQECTLAAECGSELVCRDNGGAGTWCLPALACSCEGRCCGDDGCGNPCPDTCAGICNTTTCECELDTECAPDETRVRTAHTT